MKSNIFLSDLTVVDHGYINYKGQVIGGSFNPSFVVTGSVDEKEKVVVDFSTIKKDIKGNIDIHLNNIYNNGFDHKLWFIEGYSEGTYEQINDDYVVIKTHAVEITLPTDAVKVIKPIEGLTPEYSLEYIGKAFEQYLTDHLSIKYPDIEVQVECFNNIETHRINKNDNFFMFTYSHGLKDSTSYGCQNIAHGHLSFIQPDIFNEESSHVNTLNDIAIELDGAVFINSENIVYQDESAIKIQYTTNRGTFSASYSKSANKLIVLDTETTIEYLAEYVKQHWNVGGFYISEGLSKGTYAP